MSQQQSAIDRRGPGRVVEALLAGLVGLVAVAAALGAGQLVAGILLDPEASPYLAVGNAFIDRTPTPLRDFAISTFGTNDKVALLIGMAVGIAAVAVLAGLISRRRLLPGLVVVALLGVVGILAVLEQAAEPTSVLAPITSLIVGVAAFWWLHRLQRRYFSTFRRRGGTATPAVEGSTAEPARSESVDRRKFLVGTGGVAAGAAVAGAGGLLAAGRVDVQGSRAAVGDLTPAVPAPPIPPGADFANLGTPSFITPNRDFYRIDINLQVPQLRAQDATLRIRGMVEREVEYSFEDLRRRDLVEHTITMTCVSNVVGGNLVSTSNFVGVPLRELLEEAGVQRGATQLVGRSFDGFTIGTPLERLLRQPEAMLALGMNRQPLPPEHGFPMRTVVPGLYGYVSATKWITELELTTFDFDPYWEERLWDGDPEGIVRIKTMARVDAPKPFQQIPAGRVGFAGVAWAQTTGIRQVELRVDQGPWMLTELSTEVNVNTWRMWRFSLPLEPGLHTVEVRATDKDGALQPEERVESINPGPDGATGWHAITFTVT